MLWLLVEGLPDFAQRLSLLSERRGQLINFAVAPGASFPHPLQSHQERKEPPH